LTLQLEDGRKADFELTSTRGRITIHGGLRSA
jgi:hypothetical protein